MKELSHLEAAQVTGASIAFLSFPENPISGLVQGFTNAQNLATAIVFPDNYQFGENFPLDATYAAAGLVVGSAVAVVAIPVCLSIGTLTWMASYVPCC